MRLAQRSRQANEGERLAGGVGHHHAVEVLGLALELEHLAVANIRRLGLQGAVAAIAAPQVAVAIEPEAVECGLIRGVDRFWSSCPAFPSST